MSNQHVVNLLLVLGCFSALCAQHRQEQRHLRVSVPNLPERLEKEQGVNSNLVFSSPNLPEPLDKEQGVDSNLVFSSPNLPEPLDKEQGVDSNLVFSSPNLPEPLDKEQGVDSNLAFSSPNIPEPLDKKQGVDNNLAFSSPNLPGSMDKGQDVDNRLRFSAKNIAETLAKEQDAVKNFSTSSLPAEPFYKERDTGTDFKLSAPNPPEPVNEEHGVWQSFSAPPGIPEGSLDKEHNVDGSLRPAVSLSELLDRRERVTVGDYPFRNVSLPWATRVADLMKRLTLEELQGQMACGGPAGPSPTISRLGVGMFQWATECLRGDAFAGNATAFPQALGLAAAFSPDLIYRVAEATSVEVRGKHNDFAKQGDYGYRTGIACLSPVVNIMRDPRWGRNQETYGEDPFLTGVLGAAYIRGLQGNDSRYIRASGGCKHFDVYGGPENIPVSRMSFDAKVSEEDWRMTFLPAFRSCIQAGSYSVMCSYNSLNGVPACANKELLTEILRGEWNFTGYVVSDGGAIHNIIKFHHYFNNTVDTVAACVNAGCSLESSLNARTAVYSSLVHAVTQNKVTEARVREMVSPLFYTRMRLGEFDPPEMNPYSKLSSADVETPDHKALAVKAAMKSFVLLKNNGVLPMNRSEFQKIAIVGPMANTTSEVVGDYPPGAPVGDTMTALEALAPAARIVTFASGCDDTVCQNYDAQQVLRAVQGTDLSFVVLGTGQSVESESRDRPDTELPGQQKALLHDVINSTPTGSCVVLILFNAGPVNISFADSHPKVCSIIECFFPAQATGEALRHVIFNDVISASPAGRMPFTWPLLASQIPPMVNYSMQGRTYRYFEGDPLYPFGYGLSYTTFEYLDLIHLVFVDAGQPLTGSVVVANTGKLDADEVVQVYIRWKDSSLPAPKSQLAWFQRVTVSAGQQLEVRFEIEAKIMALWIDDGWFVKPGSMDLFVGGQQPSQKRAVPSNVFASSFQIMGTKFLGRY